MVTGPTAISTVSVYDPAGGSWSTVPGELVVARRSMMSCVTTDTTGGNAVAAVFAGGVDGMAATYYSAVDILFSNGTWAVSQLSIARYQGAATAIGSVVLIGGGQGMGATTMVDIFDLAANTYSQSALSLSRHSLCAASIGTKAIFAGGLTGGFMYTTRVDIYDLSIADPMARWSTHE